MINKIIKMVKNFLAWWGIRNLNKVFMDLLLILQVKSKQLKLVKDYLMRIKLIILNRKIDYYIDG